MHLLRRSLAAHLIALIAGCSDGPDPTIPLRVAFTLSITPSPSLAAGDTARVWLAAYEAAQLRGQRVLFSSSDPAVATIDSTGRVIAVGAGPAVITATLLPLGQSQSLAVSVAPAIRITPGAAIVIERGTLQLSARLLGVPAGADARVEWSSADTSVAVVSSVGVVTGRRAGITTVIARSLADPAVRGAAQVSVACLLLESIMVAPSAVTTAPGQTVQLTATTRTGCTETTAAATFISSDPCIATVSPTGLLTAHNPGEAVVTVASQRDPAFTTRARVSVQESLLGRLVIESVTSRTAGGETVLVDPLNVAGAVTVTLRVAPEPRPASLVELIVGGRLVGSRAPVNGGGSLAFVVNTAERDAGGTPLFANGQTVMQARAHRPLVGAGCAGRQAGIEQVETRITLNNARP